MRINRTRLGLAVSAALALPTMAAADDPTAAITQQDKTDPSVLYACVGRSDIEGFVLLTRADVNVKGALALANADAVTSDMPYGGDVLFLPALNFLYLMGLIDYRPKTDAVEYVGPNETV